MKYPIDEELRYLNLHKLPLNPKLYPILNSFMKNFQCKSDEKVKVTIREIPGYEGDMLSVHVMEPNMEPDMNEKILPCIVFFHGGGFLLRASGAHYNIAKEYVTKLQCKLVYVDYRLAPEHKFPVPVEDCYATYKWVLEHAEELEIDKKCVMVGGDSAGGNLATAVTLMARDRNLPLPKSVFLIYPVTDRRMMTESMKKYIDTPVWDARLSKMMWAAYLGESPAEHIEYASLLEADSFAMFPPTYIEVAEFDALHDEGILLHERLLGEGNDSELHETKATCHGYEVAINSRVTRACMDRRIKWLKQFV